MTETTNWYDKSYNKDYQPRYKKVVKDLPDDNNVLVTYFNIRRNYYENGVNRVLNSYSKSFELEYENRKASRILFLRKIMYPVLNYYPKEQQVHYYEVWFAYGELNKNDYFTNDKIKSLSFVTYRDAKNFLDKLLRLDYKNLDDIEGKNFNNVRYTYHDSNK